MRKKKKSTKPPKGRPFKVGHPGGPGRPPDMLGRAIRQLTHDELRDLANMVVMGDFTQVEQLSKNKNAPLIKYVVANSIVGSVKRKEFGTFDQILNRVVGRVTSTVQVIPPKDLKNTPKKSYEQFCLDAGYPAPFPKQVEMMNFGMDAGPARLLLGARGIGKTDYVVLLGIAYKIYIDPDFRVLLITKSKERNAAVLSEIARILKHEGIVFEKESAGALRVAGIIGKEHSVSAVTIGTASFRGRHPNLAIMEDTVTEDDVSEATRKKVQRVYNEISKLCANVFIVGQPVHSQDLYQMLRPILKTMEVKHGEIPELDHDLTAQRLAGVSEESIQASYFLVVTADATFPFDKVKYVDDFPPSDSVAWIDPSFKGTDFTALSICSGLFEGIAVQGKVYKRAWNHCVDEMIDECVKRRVKRICIECNSLGDLPVLMLRQALAEKGISGIGVIGRDSTKEKHSKIVNAGAFSHLIHISKTSDKLYIEQVVKYEYGVKNDDAPDSLASCMEWIGLIKGKK